jgi:hypothetical protein
MKINIEIKTGFTRYQRDIETNLSFEQLVNSIWDNDYLIFDDLSIKVIDIIAIELKS